MALQIGTYEAKADVNIRREPRITNIEGMLKSGTQREILGIQTDAQNQARAKPQGFRG